MSTDSFLPAYISPGFAPFMDEAAPLLKSLTAAIVPPYNPPPDRVLRFLERNPAGLKIVILGQDPYPAPGVATGRAFEVGGLTSWLSPFRQVSLKNIIRLLYSAYTEKDPYTPFSLIKKELEGGAFSLLPPDRLFSSWEEQGVLLLNAYLTCVPGKPGSHRDLWRPFTELLLSFLSNTYPDILYFLWGGDAKSFLPLLPEKQCYCSRHPMMCSPEWPDDFLKNPCFLETKGLIHWI